MNRKCKLLLTALLGVSLAGVPVYAQQKPPQRNHPTQNKGQDRGKNHGNWQRSGQNMEKRFAKELNLTTKQQQQINPILKKQGEQMRAIFENKKLTREQKRQQSQKLFAALPSKINKYLNKTQQTKLKQMIDRRKNFGNNRGQRGQDKGGWNGQHKPAPKKK